MLLLLLAVFGLVGHWLACVFYALAYVERPTLPEPKYSWLDHLAEKYNMPFHENNSESGPDLKSKYITALFFTLTSLTSVGFGNVSPTTNWEKIFSIISMMLGCNNKKISIYNLKKFFFNFYFSINFCGYLWQCYYHYD